MPELRTDVLTMTDNLGVFRFATNQLSMAWRPFNVIVFAIVLFADLALAQVDPPAPAGWVFDDSYRSAGVLRYTAPDGTVRVELGGQPITELSAAEWLDDYASRYAKDHEILLLTEAKRDEDIINQAKVARGEDSEVDAAFLELVKRYKTNAPEHHILAAVVRDREPVQLTFVQLIGETPNLEAYLASAEKLAAQSAMTPLDVNTALEATLSGVDLTKSAEDTKAKIKADLKAEAEAELQAKAKAETEQQQDTASRSGEAPMLQSIQGPRLPITGKLLGSLPAGYRMNVNTTHYWTNQSMTATRKTYLRLIKDGQFEKGSWSISGGTLGNGNGVISSRNKNESTGSVFGNTNPSGPGARSVSLIEKKSLDPAMYGTYYISGSQIELLHANGQNEVHKFETDGYRVFFLGGNKYFASTPEGWEKVVIDKRVKYRSIDGSHIARVWTIEGELTDGPEVTKRYIEKGKKGGVILSASPVEKFSSSEDLHYAEKTTIKVAENGQTSNWDMYMRYSRHYGNRVIWVKKYSGSNDENKMKAFVRYVD